jgi:hypothetical protein
MTTRDAELMWRLERVARERHDGHFTVMRFTTNWRVMFGTPNDRDDIESALAGATFASAALAALRADADRAICLRCGVNPVDLVFLGTEKEGHLCGDCWVRDRHMEVGNELPEMQ